MNKLIQLFSWITIMRNIQQHLAYPFQYLQELLFIQSNRLTYSKFRGQTILIPYKYTLTDFTLYMKLQ